MKNELILVDRIEKKLREVREPPVFPLSPSHRKELRELRNRNIGDLRQRLRTIRDLKQEEYKRKYSSDIKSELENYDKVCKLLNNDWNVRIVKLNKILQERKELEKKYNVDLLKLDHNYNTISQLKEIKEEERKFSFDSESFANNISEKEFNKKYGKSFEMVSKKIDDVHTKYEEAINFGDLEIVKQLYYIMKSAESFFVDVSNLKV